MKENNMKLNKIIEINNINNILSNENYLKKIRKNVYSGDLLIIKKIFDIKLINSFKKYLISIGSNSLPRYESISHKTPNHHRIIRSDPRSFVKGCFHQFSFFPWNQDVFNLFDLTKKLFWLKNLLAKKKRESYLGINNKSKIISRVAFQFYPKGEGYLNLHQDPVGFHQITAPILIMSNKSKDGDFKAGGSFVLDKNNKKFYIEEHASIGDLVIYNASIPHGVDPIDPHTKPKNWYDFKGRWMMLIATNKVFGNKKVEDSKDLV